MLEAVYSVCGRFRPLAYRNKSLYVSRGYDLFTLDAENATPKFRAKYPVTAINRWISRGRLSSRISRAGFHYLAMNSLGAMVAVVRGRIVYCPPDEEVFSDVMEITRGSRPLNICVDENDDFFFGEYFSNQERRPVNIYGSGDGISWSLKYSFPAGLIRHIHGIFYDQYRSGMWVLTGDKDEESGLWYTSDAFRNLRPVVKGSQQARAVSIIPNKSGLIVPMDSPTQKNYIQHLDLGTRRFSSLSELPGSAFFAVQADDVLLVSTVVEPSVVNTDQYVSLFASIDGQHWYCIGRFARDFPQGLDRYLRYPSLVLMPSEHLHNYIYGYGIGLRGLDGLCLRWSVEDIRACIRSMSTDAV